MLESPGEIRYVGRKDIDVVKWNQCIDSSSNGVIYALSFYLDQMAAGWDALILEDYEAVFPLTWNRKYRIDYLYQPFLCASLGVFGQHIDEEILSRFIRAIPSRFRFIDIYLNAGNNFFLKGIFFQPRLNHELDLGKSYDELKADYRNSYRQLLKRFYGSGNTAEKNISIEEVVQLAREQLNPLFQVKESDYQNFITLYNKLYVEGKSITYGVYGANRQLLASGCFLYHGNRVYYVLAGNHPNGRTLGASHAMLDTFIKEHAGKDLILDFEGSDVSKIAFFFKGFGAKELPYPGFRLNRLPRLFRWLKS